MSEKQLVIQRLTAMKDRQHAIVKANAEALAQLVTTGASAGEDLQVAESWLSLADAISIVIHDQVKAVTELLDISKLMSEVVGMADAAKDTEPAKTMYGEPTPYAIVPVSYTKGTCTQVDDEHATHWQVRKYFQGASGFNSVEFSDKNEALAHMLREERRYKTARQKGYRVVAYQERTNDFPIECTDVMADYFMVERLTKDPKGNEVWVGIEQFKTLSRAYNHILSKLPIGWPGDS